MMVMSEDLISDYHIIQRKITKHRYLLHDAKQRMISARDELSNITPAYKDFPALVERAELLNFSIQYYTGYIKMLNVDLKKLEIERDKIESALYETHYYINGDFILKTTYGSYITCLMYRDMNKYELRVAIDELLNNYFRGDNYCNYEHISLRKEDRDMLIKHYESRLQDIKSKSFWR